jgi:chromosome partitioning protein
MPAHVFVSYSRDDGPQVDKIVDALKAAKLTVWRDQDSLKLGQAFWNEIENAIRNAGCLLVFISDNSLRNENVIREVEFAIEHSVPIVPLLRNKRIAEVGELWKPKIGHLHCIETNYITENVLAAVERAAKSYAFRACQTTAMFNMKGGVGKSTIAAHLASRINKARNKSVLLVDLDPQQNLTEMFLTKGELSDSHSRHRSIIGLFEPSKIDISEDRFPFQVSLTRHEDLRRELPKVPFALKQDGLFSESRLDIVTSQFEAIKYTEIGLDQRNQVIENFIWSIDILKRFYDYIIIDYNPSASLLTRCALRTCDRILAPIRPDESARRGLTFMKRALDEFYDLPRMPEINVVFNFVRPNVRAEQVFIAELKKSRAWPGAEFFLGRYLSTEIPESDVLRAGYTMLKPAPGQSALGRFFNRFNSRGRADAPLTQSACEYVELIEKGLSHETKEQRAA